MISYKALQKNAKTRLWDARILLRSKRYDSAMYLCGYAVEMGLKAVICKNLKLRGIPSTSAEFMTIQKIKTHKLEELLNLAGPKISQEIKSKYFAEWGTVVDWDPENRYTRIRGRSLAPATNNLIKATAKILKYLLGQL